MSLPEPPPGKTGWPWTEIPELLPETMPDGSTWPKISVVTPSFNQGQYIEETIRSVLLQGYPNLELIIIDGGSKDNTLEIINKYEPWLAYWVSEPDRGQSHGINKGIKQATGEILLWLNSDDLVLEGAFNLVACSFRSNPQKMLVIGQAYVIDSSGERIGELRSRFSNWEDIATTPRNMIRQVSSFFSTTLFQELGYLNESINIAMDSDLLVRFTRRYPPVIIDDFVSAFRVHSEAKTANQLIKGYLEDDVERVKLLDSRLLKKKYQVNSSTNWLSLAENSNYIFSTRMNCLVKAVKQHPLITTKRRFWSSLKSLVFGL